MNIVIIKFRINFQYYNIEWFIIIHACNFGLMYILLRVLLFSILHVCLSFLLCCVCVEFSERRGRGEFRGGGGRAMKGYFDDSQNWHDANI